MVSTSPIARYVNTPTHNFQWAQEELGCIDLGDLRSERRLVSCFADMLNSPGKSIPQCTGSLKGSKAFYRLLDNDNLTAESLLEAHHQGALRRARASAEPVMLCIQDTTTANYDTHKSVNGLGSIGSSKRKRKGHTAGLHVHGTLLTSANVDEVHGLLGAKLYARKANKRKLQTPGTRNREPITAKESYRWVESFELARQAQVALREGWPKQSQSPGGPLLVSVGDRESDIYELLREAALHREQGLGLLVRSQFNRRLHTQPEQTEQTEQTEQAEQTEQTEQTEQVAKQLWNELSASPLRGTVTLKLPRSQGQPAREVTLEVRYLNTVISAPTHKVKYLKLTEPVPINAIELVEKGVEKGIHWRLLTTLPVASLEDALRLARWYSKRWQIEVFHRTLKTGCQTEARQLRTLERLKPMLALDMITACTLMGMSAAARSRPESPASDWLERDALEALSAYYQLGASAEVEPPPQPQPQPPSPPPAAPAHRVEAQEPARSSPPQASGNPEPSPKVEAMSIGTAVKYIAKLGGHLGRRGDGPPGVQVLWQGLAKLTVITEAWSRFGGPKRCG